MHIQHTQEGIQPWRIHSGGYKDQANPFHTSSNFWRPDCLMYLCTLLIAVSITGSIYKSVESYLLQSTLFRCSLMSREILHVFKIMLIYIKILQSNSKVTSKFHFDQILFFFCRRSWETFPQKKPANFVFWTNILTNFNQFLSNVPFWSFWKHQGIKRKHSEELG